MKIPKIIHFIWAGGERVMPETNIQVIKSWMKDNPSFKIWIWIDTKSTSSSVLMVDYYLRKLNGANQVELKDIEGTQKQNGEIIRLADEYIRYEIDRIRANYGASSDLLRYKILEEFGGAYFDSDVRPGKKSLTHSDLFDERSEHHLIYVDNNSQNSGKIGNDAILCTPQNPSMHQIWINAMAHYHLQTKDLDINDHLYRSNLLIAIKNSYPVITYQYDNPEYVLEMTPFKTGPFCIRKALVDENDEFKSLIECGSTIGNLDNLTTSVGNDRNWIGKAIPKLPLSKALEIIENSIKFESLEFAILRLDDHINNLIEASECSSQEAINKILIIANEVDLDKLKSIQITYQYPETVLFCQERNLNTKTFLFPLDKNCKDETKTNKYYNDAVPNVMQTNKIKKLIDSLQENPEKIIFVINSITQFNNNSNNYLEHAVSYCKHIIENDANNNRPSESHRHIVADYLEVILENLESIAISFKKLNEHIITYLDNDEFINKQLSNVQEFEEDIAQVKEKINSILGQYNLPRGDEIKINPNQPNEGEIEEKKEIDETKVEEGRNCRLM